MLPESLERRVAGFNSNQFSSAILSKGHSQSNKSGDDIGADIPTASMSDMQVPQLSIQNENLDFHFRNEELVPRVIGISTGDFSQQNVVPRPDIPAIALKDSKCKRHTLMEEQDSLPKQVTAGISFEDAHTTFGASKLSTPRQESEQRKVQAISFMPSTLPRALPFSWTSVIPQLPRTSDHHERLHTSPRLATTKRPLKALASRFFYTLPLTAPCDIRITWNIINYSAYYRCSFCDTSLFLHRTAFVSALSWISFAESLGQEVMG